MAKIAVSSKKDKTRKPEVTGVDFGQLKVKDGRIQKKKTGKSDFVTGIHCSNIKEALQGTLIKKKSKKDKSSCVSSDNSNINGALLTTDKVSTTENRENGLLNPSPEVEQMKSKLEKDHSETLFEKVVINGSTETVADAEHTKKVKKQKNSNRHGSLDQFVIAEPSESIADTKQSNKKVKKQKKSNSNGSLDKSAITEPTKLIADTKQSNKKVKKQNKSDHNRSLNQSVSTEESSVSTNPSRKGENDSDVQTSEGTQILPSEKPTDGQREQKVKKNKLGRFEKLKVIEETRKKKRQKINSCGTTATTSSSLNDMKISLDDLQPDLDDITDRLPTSSENRKSQKLSKKTERLSPGGLGENMGDSDTDSDDEDAKDDDAVCKSYKNDFGFDEVVDAVSEEKNREEDRLEEQKLLVAANKKKKTERDDTELERTIEVINVHLKTNKKLLLILFKKFGRVESIRYRNIPVEHVDKFRINQIMKNTLDKNRSSMTAYVKFANAEAARSALEANTTEMNGHHIIVRPCVRQTQHQQREALSKGCTVFVGNLPHVAEEESVYRHFEPCGSIVNISIIRSQLKATGTAFLEFKTKEAATAALKLDDTELQHRTIRVTKAVRKVKANKKQVQSSTSNNTRSPGGVGGNKPGGRPFPGKAGANKPFVPNKQRPFQRAPVAGSQGPHNGAVKPASVQSRLSRPGQQQFATTTSSTPSGAFTGNKFDQPQKGAGKLLKKKRTKEEVKKIMLAKKLTFKKPSV